MTTAIKTQNEMIREKRFYTFSDVGAFLVNGIHFQNRYGDGTNTVIVRYFKTYDKKVENFTSAQKAYPAVFLTNATLQIYGYDCDDLKIAKPVSTIKNAWAFVIAPQKMIIYATEN